MYADAVRRRLNDGPCRDEPSLLTRGGRAVLVKRVRVGIDTGAAVPAAITRQARLVSQELHDGHGLVVAPHVCQHRRLRLQHDFRERVGEAMEQVLRGRGKVL